MLDPLIKQQLDKIFIAQFGLREEDIDPSLAFVADLGADSLDLVEIMIRLEETFGVSIYDDDAEQLVRIGTVYDFISYALKLKSQGLEKSVRLELQSKRLKNH